MLKTRVLAALVFTPAFIALVVLGGWWLVGTCLLVAWAMLWEYQQLVFGAGQRLLKTIVYLLGTAVALQVMGLLPALPLALAVPGVTLLLAIVVLLTPEPLPTAPARIGLAGFGLIYAGGLFPLLVPLRGLEAGLALAAIGFFCTWAADTGAYFSGRLLGRHKLYPLISPKKTVEGLIGGVLAAVGVAFLVRWLFAAPLASGHVLALGLLVGGVGTAGDLVASLIKRSVGAKDSSALIPGHGGVLDRFDGVMFAVPVVYGYAVLVGERLVR